MSRRNPIRRVVAIAETVCVVVAALLALLACPRANGGEVGQLARTYTYHYIGEAMPTPQRAVYDDTFLPVLDIAAQRPLTQITVHTNASLPECIGAQEVANRVQLHFWAKSDLTTCSLAATGWREKKLDRAGRVFLRTTPNKIALSPEWRRYTGSFIAAPNVTRAALKLGIVGNEKDGVKLGSLWVDDVYIGRGRP